MNIRGPPHTPGLSRLLGSCLIVPMSLGNAIPTVAGAVSTDGITVSTVASVFSAVEFVIWSLGTAPGGTQSTAGDLIRMLRAFPSAASG